MKLNKEHSLIKRCSPDTISALEKLYKEDKYTDALNELWNKALMETHISPEDNNWLIKRARLDGQESMLTILKSTIKE